MPTNGWGNIYCNSFSGDTALASGSSFSGLFDQYGYPAFGASLRLLGANYTGSAVRVRRSSDNDEQDIGFVNGELDTASLLSFVGAGDGFVTTWYDQSGNGNDAVQATASAQPQIVSAGSLLVDSQSIPTISPIALNAFMTVNSTGILIPSKSLIYTAGVYNDNADGVILSTVESIDYDNCYTLGSNFQGTNSGVLSVRLGGVTGTRGTFSESLSGFSNNDKFLTNTLVEQNFGDSDVLFNNTVADGSVSHRANIISPGFFLFRAVGFYGNSPLQEVIIYDTDVSENRANIETNINNFYNIYP